jgi:shikimate dehydrogenase
MKVTGHTAVYGVLGHPVAHSRSPAMQIAAFEACGIDAVYVALPVLPERIEEALKGAHALGFQGLNVTVPHKQRAAAACVTLDPIAREIGAANTLRRTALGWEGFNTDAPACLALLEDAKVRAGARAVILGAGGAALAAAWALLRAGVEIEVAARRPEAAEAVRDRTASSSPEAAPIRTWAWSDAATRCEGADVVVNATSIGLPGHAGTLAPLRFRPGQLAVDFVYGDTAFVAQARAGGAAIITGEQLLVRQGALAFTLWMGQPAPEAVMSAALRAAPHRP